MRCASRIHSNVGLTEGKSCSPVLPFSRASPSRCSPPCLKRRIGISHERDQRPVTGTESRICVSRKKASTRKLSALIRQPEGDSRRHGPRLYRQIGDVPVHGSRNVREAQVQPCLLQLGLRNRHISLGGQKLILGLLKGFGGNRTRRAPLKPCIAFRPVTGAFATACFWRTLLRPAKAPRGMACRPNQKADRPLSQTDCRGHARP